MAAAVLSCEENNHHEKTAPPVIALHVRTQQRRPAVRLIAPVRGVAGAGDFGAPAFFLVGADHLDSGE